MGAGRQARGWRRWTGRTGRLHGFRKARSPMWVHWAQKTKQNQPSAVRPRQARSAELCLALGWGFCWHRNRFWKSSQSPLLPSKGAGCPHLELPGQEHSEPWRSSSERSRRSFNYAMVIWGATPVLSVPLCLLWPRCSLLLPSATAFTAEK